MSAPTIDRSDLEAAIKVQKLAEHIAAYLAPNQSVLIMKKRGVMKVIYRPPIKVLG